MHSLRVGLRGLRRACPIPVSSASRVAPEAAAFPAASEHTAAAKPAAALHPALATSIPTSTQPVFPAEPVAAPATPAPTTI